MELRRAVSAAAIALPSSPCMSHVRRQSCRDRLKREKEFPIRENKTLDHRPNTSALSTLRSRCVLSFVCTRRKWLVSNMAHR